MDHFLIYIIVSSLVTLLSVTFAYKEEDELQLVDFGKSEMKGKQIETAPVYTEQPMKSKNASAIIKSLETVA